MASFGLVLPALFLSVSPASASYNYMGSSLMFTPKGQDAAKYFLLELRTQHVNVMCYQNDYACALGDCGAPYSTSSRTISNGTEDFTEWCLNEVVTLSRFKTNRPFEIRYPTYLNATTGHGYWAATVEGGLTDWRMKAHIDLGTRSDTQKANRSPMVATMPFLRIPKNCKRDYELLVFDPDRDYIRCRIPGSSGGYDCSFCALPKGFSLLKNSCTIRFDQAAKSGLYPIEMVLDDFPTADVFLVYSDGYYTKKCPITLSTQKTANSTTTRRPPPSGHFVSTIGPISIIPEQFVIQVDPFEADSCVNGDYFPIFLAPTPRNGMKIPVYADQTVKVKVRMMAKHTLHHALRVTGPQGLKKNQTFIHEYVLEWTPTKQDENKYFPICFVAEGIDRNNNIYQSEVRCFLIVVQSGATTVTCNETSMMVEVEMSEYLRSYTYQLHLNDVTDPQCDLRLLSNSTHLVAAMALHSCGTSIEEDEDNIIFKNRISSGDPKGIISRHLDVEILFACAYPKKNNLTVGFRHRNLYSFTEKGFGAFSFQFDFYESTAFTKRIDPSNYPLEVSIRQMLYMQIKVKTSVPNAELFVESCVATPFGDVHSNETYSIINNGCIIDETVEVYYSRGLQFRFGMEAFEFIDGHNQVYITCLVLLCEVGFSRTRCSQGCITSPQPRHKRETVAESSLHSISQGPVRLIKPSASKGYMPASNLNMGMYMGLNMVFIIVCVLAVSLAVHQLTKARAKYLAMQGARD